MNCGRGPLLRTRTIRWVSSALRLTINVSRTSSPISKCWSNTNCCLTSTRYWFTAPNCPPPAHRYANRRAARTGGGGLAFLRRLSYENPKPSQPRRLTNGFPLSTLIVAGISLSPLISLIAGILILVMPRLLNFIVAIYLIIIGLVGLFNL
jgi:hypothetical protein